MYWKRARRTELGILDFRFFAITRKPREAGTAHGLTQTQHQVQGGLLLDVVVSQSAAILQLLASEDQTLLVRRDALFVLQTVTNIVSSRAHAIAEKPKPRNTPGSSA